MKRQFEKVLDDFQPGLLESLRYMDDDEDLDEKDDKRQTKERYDHHDVREKLRRYKHDEKRNKRRKVLSMDAVEDENDNCKSSF
jgi:hypothetical protein